MKTEENETNVLAGDIAGLSATVKVHDVLAWVRFANDLTENFRPTALKTLIAP
jgi:hypothetical protein